MLVYALMTISICLFLTARPCLCKKFLSIYRFFVSTITYLIYKLQGLTVLDSNSWSQITSESEGTLCASGFIGLGGMDVSGLARADSNLQRSFPRLPGSTRWTPLNETIFRVGHDCDLNPDHDMAWTGTLAECFCCSSDRYIFSRYILAYATRLPRPGSEEEKALFPQEKN